MDSKIIHASQVGLFGLGLRSPHIAEVIERGSRAECFEVIVENCMSWEESKFSYLLPEILKVRKDFLITLHGVSLSIGGTDEISLGYLKQLKELYRIIEPMWFSDHLCWTGAGSMNTHDLLPLPYSQETVDHVVGRLQFVQEYLGVQVAIENVSSYVSFNEDEYHEGEFISQVVRRSGCGLLLDVNNIYVNARNLSGSSDCEGYIQTFLEHVPWSHVQEIHLAGHSDQGALIVDTHDAPVRQEVWNIYQSVIKKAPHALTILERDDHIPRLTELEEELMLARQSLVAI